MVAINREGENDARRQQIEQLGKSIAADLKQQLGGDVQVEAFDFCAEEDPDRPIVGQTVTVDGRTYEIVDAGFAFAPDMVGRKPPAAPDGCLLMFRQHSTLPMIVWCIVVKPVP